MLACLLVNHPDPSLLHPRCCHHQIGGKEFVTSISTAAPPKHKEFVPGKFFPYMGGAYAGVDDAKLAEAWCAWVG